MVFVYFATPNMELGLTFLGQLIKNAYTFGIFLQCCKKQCSFVQVAVTNDTSDKRWEMLNSLLKFLYVIGFDKLPHRQYQTYDFTRNGLLV